MNETPSTAPQARLPSWTLDTLAVLAILYTLYYGKAFLLPVVLALLLALLLSPLVRLLVRARIPGVIASAVVVFGAAALVASAVALLSAPAWDWVQQAPELVRSARDKIAPLQETVEEVNQAAKQVEDLTQAGDEVPLVQVQESSLRSALADQLGTIVGGGLATVFLLYFLLASGGALLRNLISALPSWSHKRWTLEVAHHLQNEISAYLSTITLINVGLGVVTSVALALTGIPNPILWGVLAGVLNYVPYLGPAVIIAVLSLVSMLSFPTLAQMALPPLVFLLITTLEGQMITPTLLGQRLSLNPIVIFVGLIFWGWLWGVGGALLAVPIMVSIKIVCDHIEPLKPLGLVMSR